MFSVFLYKVASKLRRQYVPLFIDLDFLQSPHQSFILSSYVEVFTLALADLCSIPPFLKPRTYYRSGVEMFIDDEARKVNV
jgi:hypothetical protein